MHSGILNLVQMHSVLTCSHLKTVVSLWRRAVPTPRLTFMGVDTASLVLRQVRVDVLNADVSEIDPSIMRCVLCCLHPTSQFDVSPFSQRIGRESC